MVYSLKRGINYKHGLAIAVLLALLSGCATPPRPGLALMADAMDCEADSRPIEDCQRMMQRGIAQVARDTDATSPGGNSVVVISF